MRKPLRQEVTHTEIDTTTGELSRIVTDEFKGYVDQEPDYVKIYIGTQLSLRMLDSGLAPLVIAFCPFMTYANDSTYTHMIVMTDTVFESVSAYLGISKGRAKQHVRTLVDAGIFIPIYKRVEVDGVVTQKKRRGQYFVNPWVIAKGSWKDIKKLQQTVDFVSGATSYFIEDEIGERKIQVNLPTNYQYELNDTFPDIPKIGGKADK